MIKKFLLIINVFVIPFQYVFSQDTLTLSDAIELGLENNYGISLARNKVAIAEINNHPGSAGMLPRADITGSRNYQVNNTYQEYFDGRIRESDDAKSNSFNAGIQVNWTLFDGFDMSIRKNRLDQMLKLSETDFRAQIENTVADIIVTYLNIVIQKRLVDVYFEAVEISAERKKFADARLTVGSGSELSFLQASVDLNADSAQWISQILELDNSKAALNSLLARDLNVDFVTEDDIPLRKDLMYEDLLERVLEVNPELLAARINVSIASLNIKETLSVMYPRINFNTGYNFNRSLSEVGILHRNRNMGYFAGVSLSYNLFNGLNTQRNIKIARISKETAHIEAEQTELDLNTRIRRIFNDYKTNLQLIQLETENLSLAIRNFQIAEEKYRLFGYAARTRKSLWIKNSLTRPSSFEDSNRRPRSSAAPGLGASNASSILARKAKSTGRRLSGSTRVRSHSSAP